MWYGQIYFCSVVLLWNKSKCKNIFDLKSNLIICHNNPVIWVSSKMRTGGVADPKDIQIHLKAMEG